MANYQANRLVCEAADLAIQVHGGIGYTRHKPPSTSTVTTVATASRGPRRSRSAGWPSGRSGSASSVRTTSTSSGGPPWRRLTDGVDRLGARSRTAGAATSRGDVRAPRVVLADSRPPCDDTRRWRVPSSAWSWVRRRPASAALRSRPSSPPAPPSPSG
ncbi:MAG: hypothetical protein R2755_11840 [Acidimicrobiales bacterium]